MSLGAFLAGHAYPGELLVIFRVHYAIALVVLAAAAAALGSRVLLAVALVLLVLDCAAIAPGLTAGSRPDPGTPRLRLVIANVWYPNRDYEALRRLVRTERPDVVGLVELTRAYAAGVEPALAGYRYRAVRPQGGAYGVGLYSRVPVRGLRVVAPVGVWPAVATGVVRVGGRDVRL